MCPGIEKLVTRILQAFCTFALWQCAPSTFCETNHVSSLRYSNGPRTGIQSFFNIADCVPNFDYSLEGIDLQANGVFINHPRPRTPGSDVVWTQSTIRSISLHCRMREKHVQHGTCVPGRAANLQPTSTQALHHVGYSRNY